jgi:hypothetical protein
MQNGKKGRNPFFLNYVTRLGSPEYECVAIPQHPFFNFYRTTWNYLVCYSYTLIINPQSAAINI